MKRLFQLLFAILVPFSKVQAQKLGSVADPIRQGLFANEPIKELVKRVKLDGNENPFRDIADASKLANEGKKKEAIEKLRSVLQKPPLETRIELWVWSGLREFGEKPDQKSGSEVLGVVMEFPMKEGCDSLAAYADGSARYLNFSGAAIFWDTPDASIKNLCQSFIDSTISVSNKAKLRNDNSLPKSDAQVTLLTRSGNYVVSQPPQSVVNAGAKLMMELMRRAKEKKG